MEKSCADCQNLVYKETKKSKTTYGYCKILKLDMLSAQTNCPHYVKQEVHDESA